MISTTFLNTILMRLLMFYHEVRSLIILVEICALGHSIRYDQHIERPLVVEINHKFLKGINLYNPFLKYVIIF